MDHGSSAGTEEAVGINKEVDAGAGEDAGAVG